MDGISRYQSKGLLGEGWWFVLSVGQAVVCSCHVKYHGDSLSEENISQPSQQMPETVVSMSSIQIMFSPT